MKKKTAEQMARQRESGKTYLAMDEETKLKIEALYICYNLNCHQIGDIVDWPWQSCNRHIKVVNDRIEYCKTTFEKLEAQGEQTIAKYGLDMFVNGIPEVPKEAPVAEPEQLAQEFPEIIQPTQEQTATESEISVPPVEDVAKAEEKDSEAEVSAESEFKAELIRIARANYPEEFLKEYNTPFPKDPVESADPERDRRVRKDAPFYLTLQNIIDRYDAGEITFEGMMLDESRGIFRVDYATA